MKTPDAALILAAARADGIVDPTGLPPHLLALADRTARKAGRRLVECDGPWPTPVHAAGRPGELGRALVLGWADAPVPEELGTYPIARLTATQTITFALCLARAWPDLHLPPYPGRPFTRAEIADSAGDIGMDRKWVKGALDGELRFLLLVVSDRTRLRLGPAVAALPATFTETMRRFHDQLPGVGLGAEIREDDDE